MGSAPRNRGLSFRAVTKRFTHFMKLHGLGVTFLPGSKFECTAKCILYRPENTRTNIFETRNDLQCPAMK